MLDQDFNTVDVNFTEGKVTNDNKLLVSKESILDRLLTDFTGTLERFKEPFYC